jgi:hypothetical protein
MKKALKWIGILLLIVVIVLAAGAFYLKTKFEKLEGRHFEAKVSAITIPTDSASIARGRLLTVHCRHCHGEDFAGKAFFDDPKIGFMASANLTPGPVVQLKSIQILIG